MKIKMASEDFSISVRRCVTDDLGRPVAVGPNLIDCFTFGTTLHGDWVVAAVTQADKREGGAQGYWGGDGMTPEERAEFLALKALCKELLSGADKCSGEPYYIVQPFLGIVKKHITTIKKHDLL